jgi:ketosteroid isomerase-like protein
MPADPTLARIMDAYKRAWEELDPALVVTVFTDDATYQEDPFSEPMAGREAIRAYWQGAADTQREVCFAWRPLLSAGALHLVEWDAAFTRTASGRRVELRGVMLLELRGGRIARFREFWHRREPA